MVGLLLLLPRNLSQSNNLATVQIRVPFHLRSIPVSWQVLLVTDLAEIKKNAGFDPSGVRVVCRETSAVEQTSASKLVLSI